MTKFQNKSFSVGPRGFEKPMTDTEWEIATGSRCPECTSKFVEGTTRCSNPLCGANPLANQLDEAAPVMRPEVEAAFNATVAKNEGLLEALAAPACEECGASEFHKMSCDSRGRKGLTAAKFAAETREMGLVIGRFDGGRSNNPGIGASAFSLEYEDRTTVSLVKKLGVVTNNEAEYVGLIDLLHYALEHGVKRIRVYGDSQLIINQTLGKWKVKHADLKPLAEEAKSLAAQFEKFDLVWIPREDNGTCDALVKTEIKAQKEGK